MIVASFSEIWDQQLVSSAIHLATPLIFAALGGLICERAGVINIALEGQMLFGAFVGVAVTWWTGSPFVGLLAALAFGAVLGLLHGWFSITLGANQIVAATAVNLLAVGVTAALIPAIWGQPGASPSVDRFRALHPPGVAHIPLVGHVVADLSALDWVALVLAPVLWFALYRLPFGLRLRACGESPLSAESVGVDVIRTRYVATTLSGMLAALGGVYLSLVQVGVFQRGMTNGRGFLALGALIFGKWKPMRVLGACALFGFADAFQVRAQTVGLGLPTELLLALPYVVALLALATFVGRSSAPAAIGKPYHRD
jgi:ABC-type uncharacterized transport system permease subunit